jgi:hypothetical protein
MMNLLVYQDCFFICHGLVVEMMQNHRGFTATFLMEMS